MIRLLSSAQMGEADRSASDNHGVSTLSLMMAAGEKTALFAREEMEENFLPQAVVVCGKGNNGGDGLAAALHLTRLGINARALLLCPARTLKGDPATVLALARKEGVRVECPEGGPAGLAAALGGIPAPFLIIDALFGTGFRGSAAPPWELAIRSVNDAGVPVLSIDLPSGLDADRSDVPEPCIRADWTLTLGAPKPALFVYPAAGMAGEVALAVIGHPGGLLDADRGASLLDAGCCREIYRPRSANSHKGTFGHLLVVAGSRDMAGAALLTARGAVRGGAGLVTLASPGGAVRLVGTQLPEVLTASLPGDSGGVLAPGSARDVLALLSGKSAVAVGPGLGRGSGAAETVRALLQSSSLPAVVDADALNAMASDPRALSDRPHPTIITPHPGELARLTGSTADAVQSDRIGSAVRAARDFRAVTVLKGAGTLVADPERGWAVNVSGNAGMAAGGMGDVLTGLIGALLAQGYSSLDAARLGVYLHGLAGDLAAEEFGPAGFTASEVADRVPAALGKVLEGHEDLEKV